MTPRDLDKILLHKIDYSVAKLYVVGGVCHASRINLLLKRWKVNQNVFDVQVSVHDFVLVKLLHSDSKLLYNQYRLHFTEQIKLVPQPDIKQVEQGSTICIVLNDEEVCLCLDQLLHTDAIRTVIVAH